MSPKMVECVSVVSRNTFAFYMKQQPTTSRQCSEKNTMSCPMFTMLKKDFDRIFFKDGPVCKAKYNNSIMPSMAALLGLKKEWGKYNHIVTFKVDKNKLYRPLSLNIPNEVYAVRYADSRLPENLNLETKLSDLTKENLKVLDGKSIDGDVISTKKITQKLNEPFTGTGFTRVLSFNSSLKSKINITKGMKEYVLDGQTPLMDVKLYNNYKDYCNNNFTTYTKRIF